MNFDPMLLLPIYLPILLGLLARATGYFPAEHALTLRQFVMKIAVPLMIFMNMAELDTGLLAQVLPLTLSLPLWMGLLWLLAVFLSMVPVLRQKRFESVLALSMFNIGYIGWAVCDLALGPEGLVRSLMFSTLYWPGIFVVAFITHLALDRSGEGLGRALAAMRSSIPVLTAFFSGLALTLLDIPVPGMLQGPLSAFGQMTSPLILFGVGLTVSLKADWKELGLLLPLRLLAGFGMALLVIRLVPGLDTISRKVILIVSLMPVAASTSLIGDFMHLDQRWLSGAITLSTLLALITIPLSLLLLV